MYDDHEDKEISLWRNILELASEHVAKNTSNSNSNDTDVELQSSSTRQLMHLSRRATSRLVMVPAEKSVVANDLFAIWLIYAKDLTFQGEEKDARLTFCHIQNQKLGEKKTAPLYLAMADIVGLLRVVE
jgi:hypothetical protein